MRRRILQSIVLPFGRAAFKDASVARQAAGAEILYRDGALSCRTRRPARATSREQVPRCLLRRCGPRRGHALGPHVSVGDVLCGVMGWDRVLLGARAVSATGKASSGQGSTPRGDARWSGSEALRDASLAMGPRSGRPLPAASYHSCGVAPLLEASVLLYPSATGARPITSLTNNKRMM
jgi:hypothetical protein